MKAEIIIPSSMTTASIAFVLDVKNERETIFIGSYKNIHDYLVKGKSSADIQVASRKLGTLAEEMNELEWTFDTVASTYEKLRPGYNDELYKMLFDYIPIDKSSNVVEIGIGGGQTILPVLKTG